MGALSPIGAQKRIPMPMRIPAAIIGGHRGVRKPQQTAKKAPGGAFITVSGDSCGFMQALADIAGAVLMGELDPHLLQQFIAGAPVAEALRGDELGEGIGIHFAFQTAARWRIGIQGAVQVPFVAFLPDVAQGMGDLEVGVAVIPVDVYVQTALVGKADQGVACMDLKGLVQDDVALHIHEPALFPDHHIGHRHFQDTAYKTDIALTGNTQHCLSPNFRDRPEQAAASWCKSCSGFAPGTHAACGETQKQEKDRPETDRGSSPVANH